jgi:hypothetical protein
METLSLLPRSKTNLTQALIALFSNLLFSALKPPENKELQYRKEGSRNEWKRRFLVSSGKPFWNGYMYLSLVKTALTTFATCKFQEKSEASVTPKSFKEGQKGISIPLISTLGESGSGKRLENKITLDFWGFSINPLHSHQRCATEIFSFNVLMIIGSSDIFPEVMSCRSSANAWYLQVRSENKSKYMINNKQQKMPPCGIPLYRRSGDEGGYLFEISV